MDLTDTIINFADDHPVLVGAMIFASAFLESVPLVGSLFPGSAVVLILSGAAGAAGEKILPLVIWGTAGGFTGDILAYWIGRRYGLTLREMWPFATRPAIWNSVATFFHRHGGKSVIVSRFLPGVRAVTPIAAGALGMRLPYFIAMSVVAAVIWAAVYVVPAAVLGQLLSTAGRISARLVGAVLTVIIALALVIWLARVAAGVISPRIYRMYRAGISRMEASPSPVARRVGSLLDPALATIGAHLLWGTVLIVSAIGLFGIMRGVLSSTQLVDMDNSIRAFARSLRSAPIDAVMVAVTAFGEGWVISISAALLAGMLLIGGARRTAAIVTSVFAATFVFVPVVNTLMKQEYPLTEIHPALAAVSFPSSHATLVTLFCGVVAALATPALNTVGRMAVWSIALAVATLVGLSRIYLDALWPSDVAGGLLLGLALTAVFAMIRTGFESELGRSLRYPLLACLAFLAVGGVRATTHHQADLAQYAPRPETVTFAEAYWLSRGWREIPIRRLDLLGDSEETISLQAAVDPAALGKLLGATGWHRAPPFVMRDLLLFLSPATPLHILPPLPLMESGRLPAATFIRSGPTSDRRMVIRLWPTDFLIRSKKGDAPLLVGSVTGEQIVRPYEALTMLDTRPPGERVDKILGDIARVVGPKLSIVQHKGPAGPVVLVTPNRVAADVSSILPRPRTTVLREERGEDLGSEPCCDRAPLR